MFTGKPPNFAAREQIMPDQKEELGSLKGHISRYGFAAKFVSDKACLDIACGSGYGSNYLIRSGARLVVGGDISQRGIESAKAHYAQDGLHFLVTDAQQLPFDDESFDAVVSLETIEHLEAPRQFLSECYRVLKPGGWFIGSTPNRAITSPYTQKPLWPYHFQEFYINELRSLAEEYFREIVIYGQDFSKGFHFNHWKVYRYLSGRGMPLILSLPKGKFVMDFFKRIVLRRQYVKLAELEERELKDMADDVPPLPLEGSLGEPSVIVLVARR